ncbi:MAG: hypothetical protein IPN94_12170 [Sphingobacteriales bacterium]|nr:hypothetical protein [Sphingobacteriales bacterium]
MAEKALIIGTSSISTSPNQDFELNTNIQTGLPMAAWGSPLIGPTPLGTT